MTGRELSNLGAELLRKAGFIVYIFNAPAKVQTRNWVDLVAIRHGHLWLVEIKGEGDRLRPGQREFAERLQDHLGEHLHYMLVTKMDQFEEMLCKT